MSLEFEAIISPGDMALQHVSDYSPHSPFNSREYAAALSAGRSKLCALILKDGNKIDCGCLSALGGSRWNKRLEIFSLPEITEPSIFWKGVSEFCRKNSIAELDIQTFASRSPSMPPYLRTMSSRDRSEFEIDLKSSRLSESFSSNHRRSIRKAARAGIEIHRNSDFDSYLIHVQLMTSSVKRRQSRGEKVIHPSARDFDFSLLKFKCGELYQASLDDRVVTSIMVLKAKTSAYYHSAGTLPDGLNHGASPYLIGEVTSSLKHEGLEFFNLGGADRNAEGLRRFKSGFGAIERQLAAATYRMSPPFLRTAHIVARRLKDALPF